MNTESSTSETEPLAYLNIKISSKGLSEFSGTRRTVFIPREEIRRIESRIGSRAERPLIQGIAGALLCGLGLLGLRMFINAGVAFLRWEAGFVLFGGLGVWFLWETFATGHYLLVTCTQGERKLVFNQKINPAELGEFLKKAAKMGYNCA